MIKQLKIFLLDMTITANKDITITRTVKILGNKFRHTNVKIGNN